jgi:hypothetical protein
VTRDSSTNAGAPVLNVRKARVTSASDIPVARSSPAWAAALGDSIGPKQP